MCKDKNVANSNINYFNFKKFDGSYLLTNDLGRYVFLPDEIFKLFISNKLEKDSPYYNQLVDNYFLIDKNREVFINEMSNKIRDSKAYLFEGTQLHIFVLTIGCNQECIYCQASAKSLNNNYGNMTREVAEKAVDIALQSKSMYLDFEFQGGEPLLNFNVLKHIVNYSKEKNEQVGKKIRYNLISNLIFLNDDILEFLVSNDVNICTSLDGNKLVHDLNRPLKSGESAYKTVVRNISKINNKYIQLGYENKSVQALLTTTRNSLKYHKEIIDEYVERGIKTISIRPLTPIGVCRSNWSTIGYTTDEFLEFYKRSLDYILELSQSGILITESHATMFLKKILSNEPFNHTEFRSPCGGIIGQIAYNHDGSIYTCDEGRMLSEVGDNSFLIGNVATSSYKELLGNSTTKALCISSCLESIPLCADCVYHPYCGTCPVYNYIENNNIFTQMPGNYRCKIYKGIMDYLFDKIYKNNKKEIECFEKWI